MAIFIPMTVAVDAEVIPVNVAAQIVASTLPNYSGPFEVTPGDTAQTLSTADTAVRRDIIINPIPSNYGKIAWNGAVLTVS